MFVAEYKIKGKIEQYQAIDDAIRTSQFIRNKCIRLWMDTRNVGSKYDLDDYCKVLAEEFDFVNELNAQARQASTEKAWSSISRFYANCKKKIPGAKGYPKFKTNARSVEYKVTGWKLINPKTIRFTDRKGIGVLKLKGSWDLGYFTKKDIKRVRLVRRADGYYCQFVIATKLEEEVPPSGEVIGLDVGLAAFYTDSTGNKVENPRFLRKAEKKLKMLQRRLSKKALGSNNRRKARKRLGKAHLKVSRQRKDFVVKLARYVVYSNDVIVYEDLRISNLVKNNRLAKSINDAAWYQFRVWLEYFGQKFSKITIAIQPHYTSQECSSCGIIVKKTLSTRTHVCSCGCSMDRDENAAINILRKGLTTVGHTGRQACGEDTSTLNGVSLLEQVASMNQESL